MRLATWDMTAGRGGVPLIRGTALAPDGTPQPVTTVPVLLEDRLAWTPLGWVELARKALRLDHATRWCAALWRALLNT